MHKATLTLVLVLCGLTLMAPARRQEDFGDAIGNYNFLVEIEGVSVGHFTGVDGLAVEQEVVEYREGGDSTHVHKLPGPVRYGNIVLKRGFHVDAGLSGLVDPDRTESTEAVSVVLLDGRGRAVRRWDYSACFAQKWELVSVPFGQDGTRLEERLAFACDSFVES